MNLRYFLFTFFQIGILFVWVIIYIDFILFWNLFLGNNAFFFLIFSALFLLNLFSFKWILILICVRENILFIWKIFILLFLTRFFFNRRTDLLSILFFVVILLCSLIFAFILFGDFFFFSINFLRIILSILLNSFFLFRVDNISVDLFFGFV